MNHFLIIFISGDLDQIKEHVNSGDLVKNLNQDILDSSMKSPNILSCYPDGLVFEADMSPDVGMKYMSDYNKMVIQNYLKNNTVTSILEDKIRGHA